MLTPEPSIDTEFSTALRRGIHDHWGLFLAEGLVLVALGVCAIVIPPLAGLATTVFLGWLFLIAGAVGLVSTLRARRAPGFGWSLVSALAALIAGFVLLVNPLQGLITLTLVLTAFFAADGVVMIGLAISHRRELSGRWEWMLINGVIDLVLAGIVISGMPGSFAWVLGLLVGIDLLFGGASLIAMALVARQDSLR
jgi:uncharacterized membrane protein HdeD (DUF308 family)